MSAIKNEKERNHICSFLIGMRLDGTRKTNTTVIQKKKAKKKHVYSSFVGMR